MWQYYKGDWADSPELVSAIDNAIAKNTIVPDDQWLAKIPGQVKSLKPLHEQETAEG